MINKYVRFIFVSLVVCGLCFAGGCRTKKGSGTLDGENLGSDVITGDYALGGRFEDGVRVPASEFSVDPVYFAYDSFRIADRELFKVSKVAAFMQSKGNVRLVVEGHCDERGSREYNMSLGEHRALALRASLISSGVSAERIQTRSYGEEKPVDSRHGESGWSLNRRGEFALYR